MSGELECQVTVQSLDEATMLFMIYRKLIFYHKIEMKNQFKKPTYINK